MVLNAFEHLIGTSYFAKWICIYAFDFLSKRPDKKFRFKLIEVLFFHRESHNARALE